jgi:uncharacterized protein YrrD
MTTLVRATSLIGQPVVTLGGDSPLEIKDVVFSRDSGRLLGFTLRKHGMLGGPVREGLSWADVHGLGPDAVVIADADVLSRGDQALAEGGDVIHNRVLTESGTDVGEVVEAVVATGRAAEVVGFEVEASAEMGRSDSHHLFIPLPDTMAISGERVIVPDRALDYVRDDLSGFGGAVEEFRSQLAGEKS